MSQQMPEGAGALVQVVGSFIAGGGVLKLLDWLTSRGKQADDSAASFRKELRETASELNKQVREQRREIDDLHDEVIACRTEISALKSENHELRSDEHRMRTFIAGSLQLHALRTRKALEEFGVPEDRLPPMPEIPEWIRESPRGPTKSDTEGVS